MLEDHRELIPVGFQLGIVEVEPGETRHMSDVDVDWHPLSLVVGGRLSAPSVPGTTSVSPMHLAPVVIVPHRDGPDEWEAAVATLVEVLGAHPDLPVTVRMPGAVVEHVSRTTPDSWAQLTSHRVLWLAGGYVDAVLAALPPGAVERQLARERTAMDGAGVTPGGIWFDAAWEPGLVTVARRAGLPLVLFEAGLVDPVPDRPGAVDRAGETVIAVPVVSEAFPFAEGDGLTAIRVEAAGLAALVSRAAGTLLNPEQYLSVHRPGARLAPHVATPARGPEVEPFYRKLLLLVGDQGDRSVSEDETLRLQSGEYVTGEGDHDAHRRLLEARVALDRATHRGDSWVEMAEVDWDADGMEEVHIESFTTSLVVDPDSASIDVWEDKPSVWPITAVTPSVAAVLTRRLTEDGEEPPVERMRVERKTEGRGEAALILAGDDGARCELEVAGRSVELNLTAPPSEPIRFGPEVPVWMEAGRLRVDGGEWLPTDEPLAVTGHRFRLTEGDRSLLISSPRPCELFLRPLPGRGLMVWPHWVTQGDATYRVTFTIT